MKSRKEPVSLIRCEVFTTVSDEGMRLETLEGFTPGKSYKIRKENFNPKHTIGMLYTVEDDNGEIREVNSNYFTAPTPKLREEYYDCRYTNPNGSTLFDPAEPIELRMTKKTKKKTKKEEPIVAEITLEDYLRRVAGIDDEFDECRKLAGLTVKQKIDSLKTISTAIQTLLTTVSAISKQLYELDKEVAVLKKTKVRI